MITTTIISSISVTPRILSVSHLPTLFNTVLCPECTYRVIVESPGQNIRRRHNRKAAECTRRLCSCQSGLGTEWSATAQYHPVAGSRVARIGKVRIQRVDVRHDRVTVNDAHAIQEICSLAGRTGCCSIRVRRERDKENLIVERHRIGQHLLVLRQRKLPAAVRWDVMTVCV